MTNDFRVAVLTGAGSGIGRAIAIDLAAKRYRLALADRDAAGLAETAGLLKGETPLSVVLDVSHKNEVDDFAAQTLARFGRVDVLINNAGVAIAGDVVELSVEEMAWIVDINFWGVVYGVKAFLPAMLARHAGTIVNVSSVFGLWGPPGNSAYAASKFAVRGFTESLRAELTGSGVHVMTVHPGGIKTNIARTSRIAAAADRTVYEKRLTAFDRAMLKTAPEDASKAILEGIEKGRDRVLIGNSARQIDFFTRLLGPRGSRLLTAHMMKAFPDAVLNESAARA